MIVYGQIGHDIAPRMIAVDLMTNKVVGQVDVLSTPTGSMRRSLDHTDAQGYCELRNLEVDAAWRGQGIGSELVRRSIAFARSLGRRATLLVEAADPARQADLERFYARLGFVASSNCAHCLTVQE